MQYETEEGSDGKKTAKVNKNKKSSKTARNFIISAIDGSMTHVKGNKGAGTGVDKKDPTTILLDINQEVKNQAAASDGLNKETIDLGMMFIHELDHTSFGGEKNDPPWENADGSLNNDESPADVRVNQIRQEMGVDWGQRTSYYRTNALDGHAYIPFDNSAKNSLKTNTPPTTLFLKF